MNPTENPRKRGLALPESIPDSEAERTREAKQLLAKLEDGDDRLLTSWEVLLIAELGEGKACTRVRLKELREAMRRVERIKNEKKG